MVKGKQSFLKPMFDIVMFDLRGGYVELMGLPEPSKGIIFTKCWNFLRGL